MDIQRIHDLIRYILTEASQDEDWRFRELGPIHIIKYMYLADMYYAVKNDGETFTGINWEFYHFGPWSLDLYKEIPNAVNMIGGETRTFESPYDKDGVRFSLKGDVLEDSSKRVPLPIVFLLRRDIRNYGNATNDLLHYVYTTLPMTNAVPGAFLDFNQVACLQKKSTKPESPPKLTARAKKKRKQSIINIREKIAKKRAEKNKKRIKPSPPRYDEVFFQGVMELDSEFVHEPIENHDGVLQVSPSAWSGNWRKSRDLP